MALVSDGWWLYVTLKDNGGNETTRSYQLTSEDAAAAATDAGSIMTALNGVTDAVITGYAAYERFVEDAFAYPAAGVEIENLALLDFDLVDHPEKSATTTIPAPNIGIFTAPSGPGANIVDPADAALVAYVNLFKSGGQALISDGEVVETFISGRRIHRASRRG